MDYVIKEDRGKAISYTIMGVSLGVIVGLNGVLYFVRGLDPLLGWSIMGGLYVLFSFILLGIIKEPVDIEKKTEGICF